MNYIGMLIKSKRKELDWSQESLAHGICAVSYLSKIEKGQITPSYEIEELLLKRLNINFNKELDKESLNLTNKLYDLLFTGRFKEFNKKIKNIDLDKYVASLNYLDIKLLDHFSNDKGPIEDYLEEYLNNKQLAMQKILKGSSEQAILLYPCAFTYFIMGKDLYDKGKQYASAINNLNIAYNMASSNGDAYLMLAAKTWIGNCYSNVLDVENMLKEYDIALKLSKDLNSKDYTEAINYNIACVKLELGDYKEAYKYFNSQKNLNSLELHKLSICLEKLNKKKLALNTINKAYDKLNKDDEFNDIYKLMFDVVKYRLENDNYLLDKHYGELIVNCFNECKNYLSIGFSAFHLPYLLEWYIANRQYKDTFETYANFPIKVNINTL